MSAEESHHHDHTAGASAPMLKWVLALTTLYLLAEVAGGLYFKSLALLSDAAHMLTDVAALVIALLAISLGKKAADEKRTFGYRRFEILAAAFNAILLFAVATYVLFAAVQRFKAPEPIQSNGMLIVATVGLLVNLLSMRLLRAGQQESMNVKGAYLEVWADMIGSVGVIGAALVIRFTGRTWVDPLVAIGIGLWVLPRTWTLLKETTNVLLEGVPNGLDLSAVRASIAALPSVLAVHDLHVWSTSNEEISCTAHVTVRDGSAEAPCRNEVVSLLRDRFHIEHCTIQTESEGEVCCSGEHAHE